MRDGDLRRADEARCARGNVTLDRRTIDAIVHDTAYAFDLADNLTQITYPSERIVAYARDGEGRVTTVTTKADAEAPEVTVASTIAWLPFGGLAGLDYGNGHALALVHDLDYRATGRTVSGVAGTVQDLAYTFDAASNITAIADAVDPARDQSFAYDALDRLTQGVGAYGTIDYTYDADGNRTGRTITDGGVTVESYAYDAFSNRLASVTVGANVRSFTYDAAGNALTDDRIGGPALDLAYDSAGRLASVDDGAALADYAHNAFGQRVRRDAGAVTHISYDRAGRRIAESDGLGATLREYIALNGVPLALIAGGVLDYVHPDHLGAPQAMTDDLAALSWEGAFRPFGEAHEITGPAANDQRFPGQHLDTATDYHYNYYRDYDPTTGRYIQSDPIGLRGGLNTYGYVVNNPNNWIDPYGLWPVGLPGEDVALSNGPAWVDYYLPGLSQTDNNTVVKELVDELGWIDLPIIRLEFGEDFQPPKPNELKDLNESQKKLIKDFIDRTDISDVIKDRIRNLLNPDKIRYLPDPPEEDAFCPI